MSVFLRKQNLNKGVYLSFVESFYNPKTKNSTQKVIKKLGYVEELSKTYTDPVAYFQEEAKRLSEDSSKKYEDSKKERIPREDNFKNIGYFLPRYVYTKFNFQNVFTAISYNKKIKFNLEEIFKFLVFSQIVNPSSKQAEFKNKDQFFEDFNFSDDQMYSAVKIIGQNEDIIKEFISLKMQKLLKLDTSTTYFDGTNIYFEIDKENEELKRGPEKNNRHDPILGMGLLMDKNGFPINYSLFPGNQSEQPELHKNVQDLKTKNGIKGRTIITADKGLNSGDNMYKAIQNGDGYVLGQKVRGSSKDNIKWISQDDENDPYEKRYENGVLIYKIKSEIDDYDVNITNQLNGQKTKIKLRQKRIVFWSKDFADKAKYERSKLIEKAKQIIANPASYLKATVGDAASYIKEIKYDKNGEIIVNSDFCLDDEMIKKAEELDGYYLIVTSETNLSNEEIINIYRGLWEIEETFSIVKGVLKLRPVFAKTLLGVHTHMLVCFTSLLILRILQKRTLLKELSKEQIQEIEKANKRKRTHKIRYQKVVEYPVKQICAFIRDYNVLCINDEMYYTTKYNDLIPFIEERFSIHLDRKILTENDVKNIFNSVPQHTTKIVN